MCGYVMAIVALIAAWSTAPGCGPQEDMTAMGPFKSVGRPPRIRPDYIGCVIPANIAPLNFLVQEEGTGYCVKVRAAQGEDIEIFSEGPKVVIPPGRWRQLLAANRGGEVCFEVYVKTQEGSWRRFESFTNMVADADIDGYLVYRLITVMYNSYRTMSIAQRCLRDYQERIVLDNSSFDFGCMNCHTFLNNNTDKLIMHTRSGPKKDYDATAMMLFQEGAVTKVNTRTKFTPAPAAFSSWHPSGKLIAFSVNKVRQFFHTARLEVRDVVDLDSNLAVFLLDTNAVTSTGSITSPDRLETFPAWSADGKHLYFCSAPVLWEDRETVPPARYEESRYDLMRIAYDVNSGRWGEPETVLSADEEDLSIAEPKCSPDGRYLVFCGCDYSGFPAFRPNSDLYLMDLERRNYWRLDCSSDEAESWPSWSSNSRWIVYSSKQGTGLFARVYISYIDENGKAHKPFLLPQQAPAFYDSFIRIYQLPELIQKPIPVRGERLARVIRGPFKVRGELPTTAASPRPGGG